MKITVPTTIVSLLLLVSNLCFVSFARPLHSVPASQCKAWLVQSIPTDMPDLPRINGVLSTGDFGYSKSRMKRFGANEGFTVYSAIESAADRNVSIRILQHSGVYPDYTNESSNLASGRPNVEAVTLLLDKWWGSGIVHAKVWISDHKDVYIGSANNDWKSLTQVKELGIYLADCPKIAKKVDVFFNNLWALASLNSSYTKTVLDQQWQTQRNVPCWSHFLQVEERCRPPIPDHQVISHVTGYPPLYDPFMFQLPLETPGCTNTTSQLHASYLSFAPPELSFKKYQTDEQGWVDTIKSVGSGATVRISTMDWLGQSQYMNQTVYWSSLSSAISEVVFSKGATVKILVAYWAHFIKNTDLYLKSLLYSNVLCASSQYNECTGKVEIKYYKVPGFNFTGPYRENGKKTGNVYPGYTRVNHGKYAVSDMRAHIGTSNLVWDYFYTTAGISFGTYNPAIVLQLQAIFDADWNSPYATPVEELASAPISSSR
ncbi:PREDICTED: phospholipase D Z-like [Nelumbo nucifera]|uniref:Phospholipase D Z-like n=1 Tax=Nelumbo nucifera TaxID=4432 RepID=A0A1U8AI95_NELNU|nr:PREDICTED: phospholipase D Z-like [Nelumbo nucifera]